MIKLGPLVTVTLVALGLALLAACGGSDDSQINSDLVSQVSSVSPGNTSFPEPSPTPKAAADGLKSALVPATTIPTLADPTPAVEATPVPGLQAQVAATPSKGQAPFEVRFTNLSVNADGFRWDFGDGATAATDSANQYAYHEYTKAGVYEVILVATTSGDPQATSMATVVVDVQPGPLHHVDVQPLAITMGVGEQHEFRVSALDRFENPIEGLTITLRSDSMVGKIDNQGRFRAGTQAGVYESAVVVEVVQGSTTKTATADITIQPGPLDKVIVSPNRVNLNIGQTHQFHADAVDIHGNSLANARLTWQVDAEAGSISQKGLLTTGTKAGTFDFGVTAAILSEEASVTIIVNPDPPAALAVRSVVVEAGETVALQALVVDQYDNQIYGALVSWTVHDINAGLIAPTGLFTAGQVARSFESALRAQVDSVGLTSTVDVTIVPGPLDRVVIAPEHVKIGKEKAQQFLGVAVDQFGNAIPGVEFVWDQVASIGETGADGWFVAGSQAGVYKQAVKGTATQGDIVRWGVAGVTIEPDRIAFISGQNENQRDIYVMNRDGSNVQRVTTGANPQAFSWSPDGKRIVSDLAFFDQRHIVAANDDGTWEILLTEAGVNTDPIWSPDGQKIAYSSTDGGYWDIYVMDVDGGNPTRITNHPARDVNPAWSPDSSKLAFASDRDGNLEIYVADLTTKRITRLTNRPGSDSHPSWSPRSGEIVFQSDQDGDYEIYRMNADGTEVVKLTSNRIDDLTPWWSPDGQRITYASGAEAKDLEIYTMSRDGDDVTRLTHNQHVDLYPRWAPRKDGVEVNLGSALILDASSLMDVEGQPLESTAGKAVVRIETRDGSGSGFIIDPAGLILSQNHLIKEVGAVTVYLNDGTSYVGSVVGRDLLRDLAVIRIEAGGLPWLKLGDVTLAPVGSKIWMAGYPAAGAELLLTQGLISAFQFDPGRNIRWVQTEGPVATWNSGGPLLDSHGQVIGLVNSKSFDVSIRGAGFAISANTIGLYLERLKAGEVITK
ncbi:MAG: PD40 domain-containing protein [Chloroflexi bacterium]|nr:PD40 domain-containing protein [Chloroflexota bacterium]